jgi:exodeoxyribonuclease V gamma subunit
MTNLKIFTSNRLEILAEKVAEVLGVPLASPLEPECIVVQSRGMERWVSMQLARRHGICANTRFPFPNTFVEEIFRKVVQPLPDLSPFAPGVLSWKIMGLLPSLLGRAPFASLRRYLGDPPEALKLVQLAERVADTFDQYLLFRPEMILRWERGEEAHWQAALWRELSAGREPLHRAALGKALLEALQGSKADPSDLPERVSVFGISALPRFHVEVLAALSRIAQVNLFLMNPCREYWGDLLGRREARRAAAGASSPPSQLHVETGTGLLASLGALGRDFFDILTEYPGEEDATFAEPGEKRLLNALQSDILNLRDRGRGKEGRTALAALDRSIQVHSCHSPMREVEVLHDGLCQLFEEDPTLAPGDILVMTPEIETHAPFIQAVFEASGGGSRRIPFTIADRSVREEGEIATAFLALLDLQGSRFGASQVLALLETRAVRRRMGLSEAELALVRKWVHDTRIRWGIDDQNRSQLGLPAYRENTWRAGLERILLGYALPGEEERLFGGMVPYDEIEGGDTLVLGRFIDFLESLFAQVDALVRPRSLREWSELLRETLDRFFEADEDGEREIQIVRRRINELAAFQEVSEFAEPLDLKVIRHHLRHSLEREGFGFGFMTGAVTFCAMLPMRSIPFRVIWLMGMNSDAYPRHSPPLAFDLMARHPRRGDRSRRNDDRYLFLEAILSARDMLGISYVGQGIQDNSILPPSVVVSELLDYLEQGFEAPGGGISAQVVTRHRLQGFSPEYFKGVRNLFSYSHEYLETARRLVAGPRAPVSFISGRLSEPPAEWRTVELGDLVRFFGNPARFLLSRRLGMDLDAGDQVLPESEPFALSRLERYVLGERLVARKVAGHDLTAYLPLARGAGRLPHGMAGECAYENLRLEVERFVAKTRPYLADGLPQPFPVDITVGDFRLRGRVDGLYGERLVHHRYAAARPQDHLRLWILHLALGVAYFPQASMLISLRPEGESVWIAWEYGPVKGSGEILAAILAHYWEGLQRPLPFFPRSSWAYARLRLQKEKPEEEALRRAADTWAGDDYRRGEGEDLYYDLCFRDGDPLDGEFRSLATELFGPLLANQKEIGR